MTTKLTANDLDDLAVRARIAENAAKLTWLKPCEAACYMNIGESTLWKLLAEGALPSSKDGGNVRICQRPPQNRPLVATSKPATPRWRMAVG